MTGSGRDYRAQRETSHMSRLAQSHLLTQRDYGRLWGNGPPASSGLEGLPPALTQLLILGVKYFGSQWTTVFDTSRKHLPTRGVSRFECHLSSRGTSPSDVNLIWCFPLFYDEET